jgi:uncharacterized protein YggE
MRLLRALALVLLCGAIVAFAGVGRPEGATSAAAPGRTVTVTGLGVIATVPDRAEFGFGVTSQAKTASGALAANAAEMRKVIAALKAAGVAAADIQTQTVSLQPRYSNDGGDIIGYSATNVVSARIKSLERAGAVIDAAVEAGANNVYGPNLTRSDAASLYLRALRSAFANARGKALALAAAAGARLGRVQSITEGSSGPPPAAETKTAVGSGTPIEGGPARIEAAVTVVYALP